MVCTLPPVELGPSPTRVARVEVNGVTCTPECTVSYERHLTPRLAFTLSSTDGARYDDATAGSGVEAVSAVAGDRLHFEWERGALPLAQSAEQVTAAA